MASWAYKERNMICDQNARFLEPLGWWEIFDNQGGRYMEPASMNNVFASMSAGVMGRQLGITDFFTGISRIVGHSFRIAETTAHGTCGNTDLRTF